MEAKTFSALQKRFKKIGLITSKELGIKNALHFDVILIDDKEMKEINFKNRKIDKPTDVLSFAFWDSGFPTALLGEIYIDIETAQSQQTDGLENEMCLLFVHGILHLLGYDHANKKEEKEMFDLQKKILATN